MAVKVTACTFVLNVAVAFAATVVVEGVREGDRY